MQIYWHEKTDIFWQIHIPHSRLPSGKAPHFLQKPTIKQQANLLVMTCNLESKPDPQIKWFRETTEIKDGGRYIIKLEKDAKTTDGFIATLQIKVKLLL